MKKKIKEKINSKKIVAYLRILFCVSFFLLCVIPILLLNEKNISKQENRTLAEFPSFWVDGNFNEKFYDQYEVYLKDHFPNRLKLIKFYYHLQYAIQNKIENENAFVGDNGWMFSFYPTRDNNIGTQKWVLNEICKKTERLLNDIKDKNIDVHFFLIPARTQIYHQYWDKHYANRQHISMGRELKKYFSDYPNVHVFFPWKQLKELSKKEDVYCKHDLHLYGKAGYQPLIDTFVEILQKKYFPQVKEYSRVEYGQGIDGNAHYADLLFLDLKRKMTTYAPVSGKYISIEDNFYDGMTQTTINPTPLSDKSVLITGNCVAEVTFAQLRELFRRTVLYRYNDEKRISSSQKLSMDDIDIIIIALPEDMMDNLNFLDNLRNML